MDSNKDDLKTVTDSPSRESPEFSTIKLDISSVAFVLDRESGRRKQLQDLEVDQEQLENTTTTSVSTTTTSDNEETTESIFRTTRDSEEEEADKFGEVVDVTITIETRDKEEVTQSPMFESGELDEDAVENVLNVEIFRLDSAGENVTSDKKSTTMSTTTITTTATTTEKTTATTTTTTKTMTTTTTTTTTTTRETTAKRQSTTAKTASKASRVRGFKRIGFNRGSVESKPRDSSGRPKIPSRRPLTRPSSSFKNRKSGEENPAKPSMESKPVIALLSHWIVDFIKNDPSLKSSLGCQDLVGRALTKVIERNSEDLEDAMSSSDALAKSLAKIIKKKNLETEEDRAKDIQKAKDSVHGNDVFRRSRVQNR